MVYLSLFGISFLAATILPLSSEFTLVGLLSTNNYNALALLSTSSIGNILGSVINWFLGFYLLNHINKKWFPFEQKQVDKASYWFQKFGRWSLLFAWVPIIGDPITFLAGILKTPFIYFLILVSIGKIARYSVLYYLIN
jgi:membrane protein YqaA with SNARE-associated domain